MSERTEIDIGLIKTLAANIMSGTLDEKEIHADAEWILQLAESLQRETETCEYHCDDLDCSPWECDKCGAAWTLESGNPFENSMKFCSDCGRLIRSVRWNEWYYNSNEDCGEREVVMTRKEYDDATEPKGEATT